MTLPSPTEISLLAGMLMLGAAAAVFLLKDMQLASYLGMAGAFLFLCAGVAHTYKQQGVDDQIAKDKPALTAFAQLKADVIAANEKAEAERAQTEMAAKSAAAAAAVALNVARTQAANAEAASSRLLAANYDLLHGIGLPGSVRDAYNAGIRLTPQAPADPPGIQPASGAAQALTLDVYAGVCTDNAVAQNALADRYDALYQYTQSLWNACNSKGP